MQTRTDKHIKGIDVSRHQGAIDWMKMRAAGVQFVYIKATEGVTYTDPKLKEHYAGARRAGLKIGFYHYARIYNDPRKEVENLLAATKELQHDLPFALDIERNEDDFEKHRDKYNRTFITDFCRRWLQHLEKLTGENPIVYTYTAFTKTYLDKTLSAWPVWIAHYDVKTPGENGVWDRWAIHQYTSSNDGLPYNGRLDVNVMEPDFLNWNAKPLPAIQRRIGAAVNGQRVGDGYLINNVSYLPARVIAEMFGAHVEWDDPTVDITKKETK
ncbi:GH25 family lysozyme [Paenibacillus sp.]|uniref:GH25 family lysozyme n=1 Tax=Paenibacillus sp. TaxID=58172 RepID=UPI002D6BC809|nr:GH25 family lysozyme [Paenibacillus sp.]HZG83819.1 GH25 family lysozyme [Paenibacillus sp.]